MVKTRFGPGHFIIEVTTRIVSDTDAVVRGAVDVYGDGQRWSFEGGKIVVDFRTRTIREQQGATLNYRVLNREVELIAIHGSPHQRGHHGGRQTAVRRYSF